MHPELKQVANGFSPRVRSFTGYDVNGYRFHTMSYEQSRPNRKTTNTGVFTKGDDGSNIKGYYGRIEEIYELQFEGTKRVHPVVFKCHWFDPEITKDDPKLGIVQIRQDSSYAGDDVYIVAQHATQVYYLPWCCQSDEQLKGWDVVQKVLPHGRLPVPNNDDYHFNANTYEGEFFQEDGLQGKFVIDITGPNEMEVDNESVVDDEEDEEVRDAKDLQLLDQLLKNLSVDAAPPPMDPANLHMLEDVDMDDSDHEDYDPTVRHRDKDDEDYF